MKTYIRPTTDIMTVELLTIMAGSGEINTSGREANFNTDRKDGASGARAKENFSSNGLWDYDDTEE